MFLGPFTCCLWLGLVVLRVEYHVTNLAVGRLQLSLGLLNRQVWGCEFQWATALHVPDLLNAMLQLHVNPIVVTLIGGAGSPKHPRLGLGRVHKNLGEPFGFSGSALDTESAGKCSQN